MPADIFSLSYLLYISIGTTFVWLASKVIRERVVESARTRSFIAMLPLIFPLLVLTWSRPDLSNIVIGIEGILPLLSKSISGSLGSLIDFDPLIVYTYLMLELRILQLVAQSSGIFLVCGIGIATTFLLTSRFLGQRIVKKMQGTVGIDKGEIPELERMVSTLSKKAGIPIPRILLTEELRPDAFAIGNGSSASLVFSVGLLATATPEEMEAIVAHEIVHLKNNDSYIKLLIGWLRLVSFYNPVVRTAASEVERERELLADQGAIELLGHPGKLISSLQTASRGLIVPNGVGIAATFTNLFSPSSFLSHHPTPEQRMASATRSRGNRSKKMCIVWISVAVMLILASTFIPGEAAKAAEKSPLWKRSTWWINRDTDEYKSQKRGTVTTPSQAKVFPTNPNNLNPKEDPRTFSQKILPDFKTKIVNKRSLERFLLAQDPTEGLVIKGSDVIQASAVPSGSGTDLIEYREKSLADLRSNQLMKYIPTSGYQKSSSSSLCDTMAFEHWNNYNLGACMKYLLLISYVTFIKL